MDALHDKLASLAMTGQRSMAVIQLEPEQLREIVHLVVTELLAQAQPAPPSKQWLKPGEVRELAGCRMQAVFDAIHSGELPAEKGEGSPRQGKDGSFIPGHRWLISADDAHAFAERHLKLRRSIGPAAGAA